MPFPEYGSGQSVPGSPVTGSVPGPYQQYEISLYDDSRRRPNSLPDDISLLYSENGGLDSPGTLGGTKGVTASKSGGVTSAGSTGATRTTVISKSGGFTGAGTLGGTKVVLQYFSKSGGIQSAGSLGATRATQISKSGGTSGTGSLGASKAVQSAKSGGFTSPGSLSASRNTSVFKSGGFSGAGELGTMPRRARVYWVEVEVPSAPASSYSRNGGFSGASSLGASRVTVISKSGGFASPASIGMGHGETATKVSGFSSTLMTGATKAVTYTKSGGTSSTGSFGADKFEIIYIQKDSGFISAGELGSSDGTPTPSPTPPFQISGGGRAKRRPTRVKIHRQHEKRQPKKQRAKQPRAKLEDAAASLISKKRLPKSYTKGAQKAYVQFQKFYGTEDGRRIFIKKALEQGRGNTLAEKVNDVFHVGTTVDQRKKMKTIVQVKGLDEPRVTIVSGHPVRPRVQPSAPRIQVLSRSGVRNVK